MDNALHLILAYRYWILFPLACFEGPITAFIIGTLVALGYFNIFAAFFLLVMGDIVPDIAYYFLGRFAQKNRFVVKALATIGVADGHLGIIENLWFKHTGKTMFFSKLAYGLSTPFLISAGFIKLQFNRYISYTVPITFIQYGILMTLGYYFGASYYAVITESVHGIGILVVAVLIVGMGYYFFTRFMRRKLLTTEEQSKNELAE